MTEIVINVLFVTLWMTVIALGWQMFRGKRPWYGRFPELAIVLFICTVLVMLAWTVDLATRFLSGCR